MPHSPAEPSDLLAAADLGDLRARVWRRRAPLSAPQVQEIIARANALRAGQVDLRIGVIHTYTTDLLDPWLQMWGALHGMGALTYHAPYGLSLKEAAPESALLAFRPDITLLMLRREDLHPELALPIVGRDGDALVQLRAESLTQVRMIVELFRAQKVGHLVLTFLPAQQGVALGNYDAQSTQPESAWWATFKSEVGHWLSADVPSSTFLDLDDALLQIGRDSFFDRRYWYTAQYPFTAESACEVARRVVGVGVALKTPRAKVLVVDADNTLWGGVVGEDGIDGISLGPDYPGAAFRDFQRRILDFQQRGLILALCSKNNMPDVAQILREHPHQMLRDEHFAACRVNWLSKVENLVSLADELKLGLDSFIFVDDSAHECAAVRHSLPDVEVIQTPARPVDIPTCLDHVARLEVLTLTNEDVVKTELYAQERRRREFGEALNGSSAADQYLARLEMTMLISLNDVNHLSRLSQLTQKTNQFNLTTRRYDEEQMKTFILSDEWLVADFSLADVFGDSGIVGLALLRILSERQVELDTFLMSCRVIGREAEGAFLHALLRHLSDLGVDTVLADFVPSAKNAPAKSFLSDHGFCRNADGRPRRDLRTDPAQPEGRFPIAVTMSAGQRMNRQDAEDRPAPGATKK
jgi:FkbH-like protein